MNPVAYARFQLNKLELRRDPAPGFKPLVWADSKPPIAVLTPEEVARLAAALGWQPPPDRAQLVRAFLADKPLGATRDELRTVTGLKQVLRVLSPMRAKGELRCRPAKGRGARWYLPQYELDIQRYFDIKTEKARAKDREQSRERQRQYALERGAHNWWVKNDAPA